MLDELLTAGLRTRLEAPYDLHKRVSENLCADTSHVYDSKAAITVEEINPTPFVRNKPHPFEEIKYMNNKIEFYRYGELKRIIDIYENEYHIKTFLENDEEGPLLCMRDSIGRKNDSVFVHGELFDYRGKGILVVGNERSGKTSLLTRIISETEATFIGDEIVRLSGKDFGMGYYVPHTVFLRFGDINRTNLQTCLEDITATNASQYMDQGRVDGIVAKEMFDINAGIVFSRKRFCELLNAESAPSTKIDKVIETNYVSDSSSSLEIVKNSPLDMSEYQVQLSLLGRKPNYKIKQINIPSDKIYFNNSWTISEKDMKIILQ